MIEKKTKQAWWALRNNGFKFCVFRACYGFKKRTGLLKRKFPAYNWADVHLTDGLVFAENASPKNLASQHSKNSRKFFFEKGNLGSPCADNDDLIEAAQRLLDNQFCFFFSEYADLGRPVNWFYNLSTGREFPDPARHWCDTKFFEGGDIKYIWEPARFAWAYTLVRAFSATQDEKYAAKFFEIFKSWLKANPYNIGPNYACGQECAIRLMAMVFSLYALAESKACTNQRQAELIKVIGLHAQRIYDNIDFAISTRTNHSITEAAGLYTAGLLFGEFKKAGKWFELGKSTLIKEGLKQIYEDGSYIQHSMNYHRLMLQNYIWCIRLGQLNNDAFPEQFTARLEKAVDFLYQMMDMATGRVPNYGANDGALIMPLNDCDYLDYRPVVQSGKYLFSSDKCFQAGPWDEDLYWLFGTVSAGNVDKPAQPQSVRLDSGGYYTLRNSQSWAMMRAHEFCERPGHADLLHLDLWYKGLNILRDSGSYMYNCPQPWQYYFSSTMAHNAVRVDNLNQMEKAGRFMWAHWARSEMSAYKLDPTNKIGLMQGLHYGYYKKTSAIHKRTVVSLPGDSWVIVDEISGSGKHLIELLWQLPDVGYELADGRLMLSTPTQDIALTVTPSKGAFEHEILCRGSTGPGWQSLYYGKKTPAPAYRIFGYAELPLTMLTVIDCQNLGLTPKLDSEKFILQSKSTEDTYNIRTTKEPAVEKNKNLIL